MSLKNTVEAVLFAVGKRLTVEDIAKFARTKHLDDVKAALAELKEDYSTRDSAVHLSEESGKYKLAIKDEFLAFVQDLISETDLSKSVMETLAVIAWKFPCLQSEVIHIRTNKAYDHLTELEEKGFIERFNYGRTRKIRLTNKFFTYFDLPSAEHAQEVFKKILPQEIKDKIEAAEKEITDTEKLIEDAKDKDESEKESSEKIAEVIADDNLEKYADDQENISEDSQIDERSIDKTETNYSKPSEDINITETSEQETDSETSDFDAELVDETVEEELCDNPDIEESEDDDNDEEDDDSKEEE